MTTQLARFRYGAIPNQIYVERGLDENLAKQVVVQLTEHDALGAYLPDELFTRKGIPTTSTSGTTRPETVPACR